MCRLLLVTSARPFDPCPYLRSFAEISRNSREYQGHGWGCASWDGSAWALYRNIRPVWEDDLSKFAPTTRLLGHARSAFRDEGIAVENNMPFSDGRTVFAFNGELHGVRLRAEGRIGAEKIYNLIRGFDHGDRLEALRRATDVIEKRSRYVRAMNIVWADGERAWASSLYSENPEYFTLRRKTADGVRLLCSEPFPDEPGWEPVNNRFIGEV
jgi:predicted glutamine amidotransferase